MIGLPRTRQALDCSPLAAPIGCNDSLAHGPIRLGRGRRLVAHQLSVDSPRESMVALGSHRNILTAGPAGPPSRTRHRARLVVRLCDDKLLVCAEPSKSILLAAALTPISQTCLIPFEHAAPRPISEGPLHVRSTNLLSSMESATLVHKASPLYAQ